MPSPRLLVGSPAALEAAFVAEARRGQAAVLIGHRLLRPYLRRLLGRCGGFFGGVFATPEELAWRLHPPDDREPLPRLAWRAIIEDAALAGPLHDPARTGYFAPVAGTPGFIEALDRLATELRRAGVTPEALARPVAGIDPEKLAHLAGMLAAVRDKATGWRLPDEPFFRADPTLLGADRLLVYGVWTFDAAERALLDRLAEGGVEIVIFLPDADEAAFGEVVRWVRERAPAGSVPEAVRDPAAEPAREAAQSALDHLKAHLFALPAEAARDDGTVQIVSAPDAVREVREAARACLRWAEEGIPFHHMAVVYRSAQPYRALVEEVFGDAGIPVYLHDGRPLAQHPTGRRVLALLDLLGGSLERAAVMAFLAEAALPEDAAAGVEPAAWDSLSKRAGIVSGRAEWRARLARLRGEIAAVAPDHPDLLRIDALRAWIDDLGERLERLPARASWAEYLDHLADLLARSVAGSEPVARQLEALRDLDAITGDVPLARFQATVRGVIATLDADETLFGRRRDGFGREGVAVLDLFSTRGLRFEAVAIVGLAERQFPGAPAHDPLLLDHERAALNAAHGWAIPLRAASASREPAQFAALIRGADRRLQLSFPRTETGTARPALPSVFIRAAAEALLARPVAAATIDRLPAFFRRVPASRFGVVPLELALDEQEYDRSLLERDPRLAAALDWPTFERVCAAWRARTSEQALTPYDGIISAVPPLALSPTKLETYATCPYQFFVRSVLRASREEEPELIDRITARDRGALIHAVLEQFYRQGDLSLDALLETVEQVCAEFEATGRAGRRLLWELERRQIREDLQDWWQTFGEAQDGFQPVKVEARFDGQPFIRVVSGVEVAFSGVIDRVDRAPDGRFRVVDYKTGKLTGKDNDLRGGRALQLPFYLDAAAALLGAPPTRGEAVYESVTRVGGFKRVRVDSQFDWAEFDTLLAALVAAIREGDFHPVPGDPCRQCAARPICGPEIEERMERKAGDPRVQRLLSWRTS
ncbi:MAG: PD-(D/E)XK nuclease family protein [Chloroflexota bacterium]|nr:PD-(D/E)XK nuclease family protein [Dehalococcoidia bacterium]MDW8255114.1 PD-(D/E)XK nuclease family protein [Chloroflexota bacterium]